MTNASDVFDIDDGVVVVMKDTVDEAARSCPVDALTASD